MDQSKLNTATSRVELMTNLAGTESTTSKIRLEIYRRLADIAKWKYSEPALEAVIRGNADTFKAVLSPVLVAVMVSKRGTYTEYSQATTEAPELEQLISNGSKLSATIKEIEKIIGEPIKNPSYIEVVGRIRGFNPSSAVPSMDNLEDLDDELIYFEDTDEDDDITEDAVGIEKGTITPQMEVTGSSDELSLDHQSEVVSNTNRIMSVYKDLFEVGFDLVKPFGILIKDGVLSLKGKSSLVQTSSSFSKLYEVISQSRGGGLVQSVTASGVDIGDLRSMNLRRGTDYYPLFQLANILGAVGKESYNSWDEFSSAISGIIRSLLAEQLKAGNDIAEIVEALTTCIVVSEFDPSVCLKLRVNIGYGEAKLPHILGLYTRHKKEIFGGTGAIFRQSTTTTGVVEITFVFSEAAYNGRPLFAYEAVKLLASRGKTPSIDNVILGQSVDGKIFTKNLNKQNSSVTLIGAGQRSGKGVLTLNLVGTILASGSPLIYCDGKPDMAKALWEVTSKNNVQGAIWDAFKSNGIKVGNGAPPAIRQNMGDIFGFLVYFKVLQLMLVASHLRASGRQVGGTSRPFFIFDEALAVQQTLAGIWPSVVALAKDKKNSSEEAEWARAVGKWMDQLSATLASTVNSQLPISNISTIWLFQSVQPTEWRKYALKSVGTAPDYVPFLSATMSRMSIKLYGKGTSDSEYGLGNVKIKSDKDVSRLVLSGNGRNFAYSESQKITDIEQIEIFKPYLVLNDHKKGSESAEELRKNVGREVWSKIAPTGELDPGAGFEGFASLLGKEAIDNFQKGREFLTEVMGEVGLSQYNSIEDYIYDASAESFKSVGVFLNDGALDYEGEDSDDPSDVDLSIFNRTNTPADKRNQTDTAGIGVETPVAPKKENRLPRDIANEMALGQLLDSEVEMYEDETETVYHEPITIDKRNTNMFSPLQGNSRRILVDTSNSSSYIKLTKDNCIDCRSASPGPADWIENIYLQTPKGVEKYIQKMWDRVLRTVVNSGLRPAFITKVSIFGNNLYINGKIVNLNGVIGGYEAIMLRDIVSYKVLFKRYFMIKEIRLDEEQFRSAVAELGDNTVEKIFEMGHKLEKMYILGDDQSVTSFDRASIRENKARDLEDHSKKSNNLDLVFKNNSKKAWEVNSPSSNIWGIKLAKGAMGNAGAALMDRNKPSLGKALGYAIVGATAATIGTAAWGVVSGVRAVLGVFRR